MIFSYKKYFLSAAIASLVPFYSLHAHNAHNAASVMYLLALHMENMPQDNINEKNKKIVQEIIQYFHQHGNIDPQLLQDLYLWLDLKPDDFEGNPSAIVQKILQKIEAQPNISFNKESNSYHSLGSKNMSSYTQTKNEYYITLAPQEKNENQSIQAQINNMTSELNQEEDSFEYVELRQVLENNYKLPQNLQEKLLASFKELVKIRHYIKLLHKKKRETKSLPKRKEIRKEIKNKKQEKQALFKQLKQICLKCNLDYDTIKDLLTDSEEVRMDLATETLQTAVDTVSKKKIVPHGNFLLLCIDHKEDSIEKDSTSDQIINKPPATKTTITDPYENEQIVLKDYQTRQKIFSNLVQYLKITIDPETGLKIYTVYYQVYNKKKARYDYYKYTPKGFKKIREKTFFQQSKSKDVHFLVYQKVNIIPFFDPIPWTDKKTLEQLRNIFVGAIAAFVIVAIMQIGEEPNVIYIQTSQNTTKNTGRQKGGKAQRQRQRQSEKQRRAALGPKRIKGAGLPNIGDSCYWNSLTQVLYEYYDFLIKDQYYGENHPKNVIIPADIKQAYTTLFQSMKKGGETGNGVSYKEVWDARDSVAKYQTDFLQPYWRASHGPGNLRQEDAHELMKALTGVIEQYNQIKENKKSAEAIPVNIDVTSTLTSDYKLNHNSSPIIQKTPTKEKLDAFLPLQLSKESTTLKQLLENYSKPEVIGDSDRVYKDWDEFCGELKIDVKEPSKDLIAYLLLQEYKQLQEDLDKLINSKDKEVISYIIENGDKKLNDKKDKWLANFNALHRDTKEYDTIQSVDDAIVTGCIKLIQTLKENKVSQIPALIAEQTNGDSDQNNKLIEHFVLETVKECIIDSKIFGTGAKIDKAYKLHKKIKDRNLSTNTEDETKLLPKAVQFFTSLGFDENDITAKLKAKDIKFDSKDGKPSMTIGRDGTKEYVFQFSAKSKNKIFAIQLVRFPDKGIKNNVKVTDCMEFTLDKKYVKENKPVKFKLCAAVIHHGAGLISGHYTACVKSKANGKWKLFNDSSVSPKIKEQVKEIVEGNGVDSNGYLLFFEHEENSSPL